MPIGLPADADVLRKHSTWFITYGVIMILLGAFAIIAPGVATLAATLMVGWLLLLGGAFGLFAVISGGTSAPGFWWNLLTTAIYFLAGLAVLTRPIAGVLTLTLILAAYLLAGGVFRIMMGMGYRAHAPRAWFWLLLSGVVICSSGACAEGAISSSYTDLSGKACRTVARDKETGASTIRCPGVGGYSLLVLDSDDRASISVVAPGRRVHPLKYWDVVAPSFSTLDKKAEWRVVEQPDVGRVADHRSDGDEIEEAEDRASRELRKLRI